MHIIIGNYLSTLEYACLSKHEPKKGAFVGFPAPPDNARDKNNKEFSAGVRVAVTAEIGSGALDSIFTAPPGAS